MLSDSLTLAETFEDPAVKAFGNALRDALRYENDFASLIDFENAETPEAFAEAVKRFLRRNYKKHWRPCTTDLQRLIGMARTPGHVKFLRAAIVSYGLCRWDAKESRMKEEKA